MGIRGIKQPLVESVGTVDPLTGRTAHVEDGLSAVAVDDLLELCADGFHGFIPGNALPTRLFALGVRALHGVINTIGMVCCLNG